MLNISGEKQMNNIWHEPTKIPEPDETYVVYKDYGGECKFVNTDSCREREDAETEEEYEKKWNLYVKVEHVVKWAYLSDFIEYFAFCEKKFQERLEENKK
jgi:hypothetical protein